jgi:hypothetical protein
MFDFLPALSPVQRTWLSVTSMVAVLMFGMFLVLFVR